MPAVFLSDLHDDLLCHILSFAPIKEAASTSALARRWHKLWLLSGALNLDSRTCNSNFGWGHSRRSIFQRHGKAAMAAYGSSSGSLKKLTFWYDQTIEDEHDDDEMGDYYDPFVSYQEETEWAICCQLNDSLSNPAARHLEELYFGRSCKGEMCSFRITSLPTFNALRVLHIANCIDKHSLEGKVLTFPRLNELQLHQCYVSREILQGIIDASPLLNTLQLNGGCFSWFRDSQHSLSLPKVTTLLLENFHYTCYGIGQTNLELDAPNLRCFTYKGSVPALSLMSPAPHFTRVELQFDLSIVHRRDVECQLFWQFVSNFSCAKMLMLRFKPLHLHYHHAPGPGDV